MKYVILWHPCGHEHQLLWNTAHIHTGTTETCTDAVAVGISSVMGAWSLKQKYKDLTIQWFSLHSAINDTDRFSIAKSTLGDTRST